MKHFNILILLLICNELQANVIILPVIRNDINVVKESYVGLFDCIQEESKVTFRYCFLSDDNYDHVFCGDTKWIKCYVQVYDNFKEPYNMYHSLIKQCYNFSPLKIYTKDISLKRYVIFVSKYELMTVVTYEYFSYLTPKGLSSQYGKYEKGQYYMDANMSLYEVENVGNINCKHPTPLQLIPPTFDVNDTFVIRLSENTYLASPKKGYAVVASTLLYEDLIRLPLDIRVHSFVDVCEVGPCLFTLSPQSHLFEISGYNTIELSYEVLPLIRDYESVVKILWNINLPQNVSYFNNSEVVSQVIEVQKNRTTDNVTIKELVTIALSFMVIIIMILSIVWLILSIYAKKKEEIITVQRNKIYNNITASRQELTVENPLIDETTV